MTYGFGVSRRACKDFVVGRRFAEVLVDDGDGKKLDAEIRISRR